MGDNKKTTYSDINKKYSFLNEGVEGLKNKQKKNKRASFHSQQEIKANQNRKRRATLREEKRRIMQEQRDLGHTVKLNPQEIEFERRRLEQLNKRKKAEEIRKKKARRNRIFLFVVTLIIVVLLAVLLKNILTQRAQANEQAANQDQIKMEEVQKTQGNTDSNQLLGFNKTANNIPIYKDPNEDQKLAEIPKESYVKNYGTNGTFTKVKYLDQEGYVQTSDLVSVGEENQLKVINGILIVNNDYTLPEDYNPGIDVDAQKAFGIMVENAKTDKIILKSASDYRNYEQQTKSNSGKTNPYGEYKDDSKQLGLGSSEHQTGLAYDIMGEDYNSKYSDDFAQSKEATWLRENAYKYGFIERYPKDKESITHRRAEPWHYRYVGVDIAQKIHQERLTLEEYLNGSSAPTTIQDNNETQINNRQKPVENTTDSQNVQTDQENQNNMSTDGTTNEDKGNNNQSNTNTQTQNSSDQQNTQQGSSRQGGTNQPSNSQTNQNPVNQQNTGNQSGNIE